MKRRAVLTGGVTAFLGSIAGCSGLLTDDPAVRYDIGMGGSFFRPEAFTVDAGTTVVWMNTGSRAHTVTAYENMIPDEATYFASGGFRSEQAARDAWVKGGNGAIFSRETFEHTFEVPGEYIYFCIPHESANMIGRIIVE